MGRIIYSLAFLILLSAIAITAYSTVPSPGHGADDIYITLSNSLLGLQDAINASLLLGYNLTGGNNPNPVDPGHSSSKIIVSVSGKEETLQEAINSKTLCSNTSSSSYSQPAPIQGHLGNQIVITNASGVEKTLQQTIDNKEFCTCGNHICENGSAGNPRYGENYTNCLTDCPVPCPSLTNLDQGTCTSAGGLVSCRTQSGASICTGYCNMGAYCLTRAFDNYNTTTYGNPSSWVCICINR